MKPRSVAIGIVALVTTFACKSFPEPATVPAQPASAPSSRPADSAVAERIAAAKARLEKTEAGKIVLAATEAHGGLKAWFEGRALQFRYDYQPVKGAPRQSLQTIDLLSARAYHELDTPKGPFAWDGKRAWMKFDEGATFAARFWALTPYYFVAMPFVLSDVGVQLAFTDDDPNAAGFADVHVIKATFTAGTGDAPDDYYVLYIDKADHHVLALRYVVTYAPFFADKPNKSTPEKLLVYEDIQAAGPIKLARRQTFFAFADGTKGDKVTVAEISDVTYGAQFDDNRLVPPEGATFDESM